MSDFHQTKYYFWSGLKLLVSVTCYNTGYTVC